MTTVLEIIPVESPKVACSGDKDSAHPRVYLLIGAQGGVDCPYCGKRYALKEGANKGGEH